MSYVQQARTAAIQNSAFALQVLNIWCLLTSLNLPSQFRDQQFYCLKISLIVFICTNILNGFWSQVRLLQETLKSRSLGDVDVRTVDGFQGQERQVIIVSSVVSDQNVGFLNKPNRYGCQYIQ